MKNYFKYMILALSVTFGLAGCEDNANWRIIPYEPEPEVPVEGPPELRVAGDHQSWNPEAEVIGKLYPVKNEEGNMDGDYAGYVYLNTQFKICPETGWEGAFGSGSAEGTMDTGDGLDNLTVPAPGYYYLSCNIKALTWKAEVMNFGLIGDATPGGWSDDTALEYDEADLKLKATLDLQDGNMKFRANASWDDPKGNLGIGDEPGKLVWNGGDIPVTAGKYEVVLDLSTPNYSYELNAQ